MLDLLDLTASQKRFRAALRDPDVRNIIWVGARGSGKTSGVCFGLTALGLENLYAEDGNHRYAMVGVSATAMVRNCRDYFADVSSQLGVTYRESLGQAPVFRVEGAEYHIFGGDNVRSRTRIQGFPVHTVWVDEASLVHPETLETALQRRTFATSKLIITMNAGAPGSKIKREFVDRERDHTVVIVTDFEENQHFPEEMREEIRSYDQSSFLYKRNILNQWAAASGLCYNILDDALVSIDVGEHPKGVVGIDLGAGSVTAASLFVQQPWGWHIAAEYHHDAKDGALTDEEHILRILAMWDVEFWVPDPSAKTFKETLRRYGQPFANGKNDLHVGIQAVNDALLRKRLTIEPGCTYLRDEASALTWNEVTEKPQSGLADHHCDATRYGTMHLMPPRMGWVIGGR